MVERYRRGKGKRKLLGSHRKCWIWGRHAVLETLRAGAWPIVELHLSEELPDDVLTEARGLADHGETLVLVEPAERLRRLCHSSEHQGYLAKMPEFPYADRDRLLDRRPENPLYVVLDALQDPYNFGAILRSADALRVDAVFIGEKNQVGVTSLVARSSSGAVNHVPIARIEDLPLLLDRFRELGIAAVAASEKADRTAFDCDFRRPTAIVIGSEGAGIRDELLDRCDRTVSIPQFGHVGSLNAAVSAGILLYEVCRQRVRAQRDDR